MTRAFVVLFAFAIISPAAFAQQLPPPRDPAGEETETPSPGPALIPPQNAPQQPPQGVPPGAPAQPAQKNAGQPPAFFAARRQALSDRKQAQKDRMRQFKADRAAEQQKLYQDWHERYLADVPVRVEYYRALATAYQSQPAIPYYGPYFYGAGPAVILPAVYAPVVVSAPIYQPFPYGTFFSWGW
jgi:hypothetical protein